MESVAEYVSRKFPGEIVLEFNEDRTKIIGAKSVIDLTEWLADNKEWVTSIIEQTRGIE